MTTDMLLLVVLIVGIALISGSFSSVVVYFIEMWKGLVDA